MSKGIDITMEDVDIAIKVINEFIRRSREAQMTIKRLEVTTVSGVKMPTSMQDFMNMAYGMKMREKEREKEQQTTESQPEPLTEEELKRMREIKEKMSRNP
jgi:hypothetical protein